jgi:hypothetical protein
MPIRKVIQPAAVQAEQPDTEPEFGSESYQDDVERIIQKYRAKINGSPIGAIRAHCVECMGGAVREIARCTADKTCSLHPFRMGVNIFDARSVKARERKETGR